MIGRRTFLRFAPGALVVGKEAGAEKLAGMGTVSGVGSSPEVEFCGPAGSLDPRAIEIEIPDWRVRQAKQNARKSARRLDPDIVTMQSISLNAKYQMQMRRNMERELERELATILSKADRHDWSDKHAFWLP